MAIECKNCGTMNPVIEKTCVSCGEKLDKNQQQQQHEVVEGSAWAAVLSVFLIIFGLVLLVINFIYLFTVDGYGVGSFLLGLLFLGVYFVFFGALLEAFDNLAKTKNYMRRNHDYLKKIAEKNDN